MQTGDLGSLRAGVFPGDEIQHLATIDALGHFVYATLPQWPGTVDNLTNGTNER